MAITLRPLSYALGAETTANFGRLFSKTGVR